MPRQNPVEKYKTTKAKMWDYIHETQRMIEDHYSEFGDEYSAGARASWKKIETRQKRHRVMQDKVHQLARESLSWQNEQFEKERKERRDKVQKMTEQGTRG